METVPLSTADDVPGADRVQVGGRFQGYRLQQELGRGPLATVYRAVDEENERPVALKLFDPRFRHEPRFAIRFRRHLRAIVAVEHPHLLRVYDYGLAGDHFYIVNEPLDGLSLATLLAERGALPPAAAAHIARQMCAGLAAAHERGLVHRNLKPENVLVSGDGHVKVADVGLSSLLSESGLSRTSIMLHSVDYMAPEQGRGKSAGPAADIYSAGVILFEMLAGRRLFASEDVWRIVQMHLQTPPPSIRRLNPEVPPEMEAVVARSLRKDPADRFATVAEMGAALAPFAAEIRDLELPEPSPPVRTGGRAAALRAMVAESRARLSALARDLTLTGGPRRSSATSLLLVQFVASFILTLLLLLALTGGSAPDASAVGGGDAGESLRQSIAKPLATETPTPTSTPTSTATATATATATSTPSPAPPAAQPPAEGGGPPDDGGPPPWAGGPPPWAGPPGERGGR